MTRTYTHHMIDMTDIDTETEDESGIDTEVIFEYSAGELPKSGYDVARVFKERDKNPDKYWWGRVSDGKPMPNYRIVIWLKLDGQGINPKDVFPMTREQKKLLAWYNAGVDAKGEFSPISVANQMLMAEIITDDEFNKTVAMLMKRTDEIYDIDDFWQDIIGGQPIPELTPLEQEDTCNK